MKYKSLLILSAACIVITTGCSENKTKEVDKTKMAEVDTMPFEVDAERFGDLQVLRYQVKGFDELSIQQKQLAYYLYEAAMCGRDIIYDQKYKYNLTIRKTIDAIYSSYTGNKSSEDWKKFELYAKKIWFSNGIHHHYSNMKMMPEFTQEYFNDLIKNCDSKQLPLEGKDIETLITILRPILFDEKVDAKIVDQSAGIDNIKASANNFYEGLSQKEVEGYYAKMADKGSKTPIMYGLNSKLVKENGKIVEKAWKVGGMYSAAIEKIVFWLEKASGVAENA